MALEPGEAKAAAQPTRKNVLAHGENSSMFKDFKRGLLLQTDTNTSSKISDFLMLVLLKLTFTK